MNETLERICEEVHDRYEENAAIEGWATNPKSRVPWADVPETNRATMRAALKPLAEEVERLIRRVAVLEKARKSTTTKRSVGWAYWLQDHWHLCADEPVAHEHRHRVVLESVVWGRDKRIAMLEEALEPFAMIHRASANWGAMRSDEPVPFPNNPRPSFDVIKDIKRAHEALEANDD